MQFDTNIRVLTVRQPYAWLIVNAYKDVENRSYFTSHRGQMLILAAVNKAREFEDERKLCRKLGIPLPAMHELKYGGIVGMTHLTHCTRESDSPWFSGPVGWELERSQPLPFVPATGMLSLFKPAEALLRKLSRE